MIQLSRPLIGTRVRQLKIKLMHVVDAKEDKTRWRITQTVIYSAL